jgi:hypothetical protein
MGLHKTSFDEPLTIWQGYLSYEQHIPLKAKNFCKKTLNSVSPPWVPCGISFLVQELEVMLQL